MNIVREEEYDFTDTDTINDEEIAYFTKKNWKCLEIARSFKRDIDVRPVILEKDLNLWVVISVNVLVTIEVSVLIVREIKVKLWL